MSGNDGVLLTILYIYTYFVYLFNFKANPHQYLPPHLTSISGILIRILRSVFTSAVRLVFKPYLSRIWSMQSWKDWKSVCQSISVDPIVNVSYQCALPSNLRMFDYQIVWERLTVKFSLLVLPSGNNRFYKFVKVYRNYCCKGYFALLTHMILFYPNRYFKLQRCFKFSLRWRGGIIQFKQWSLWLWKMKRLWPTSQIYHNKRLENLRKQITENLEVLMSGKPTLKLIMNQKPALKICLKKQIRDINTNTLDRTCLK